MFKVSQKQLKKLQSEGRIIGKKKSPSLKNNQIVTNDTHKKGRIPKSSITENQNQFICHLNIKPQSKQRARTFLDKNIIAKLYNQSCGNLKKFMGLISSNQIMKSLTPEDTKDFEYILSLEAKRVMTQLKLEPFECPVEMDIIVRIEGNPEEWPVAHHDGDLDNHEKAIKDALNGIVYLDDRLVVKKTGIKICSKQPGIDIIVKSI
jgi:Holliday junction resolvase RusA-like endonuclease